MAALFFGLLLMTGIGLLVYSRLDHEIYRGEKEARDELSQLLQQADLDAAIERSAEEAKQAEQGERSVVLDSIARRLERSHTLRSGDGRTMIDKLQHQLELAGYAEKMTPYQAIAFACVIWGVGLLLPTFMVLVMHLPAPLYIVMIAIFGVFPFLRLRGAKAERADKIRIDLPIVIYELAMAMATQVLTIEEALAIVSKAESPEASKSPLRRELARAYREVRYGNRDRDDALYGVVHRTGLVEIRSFIDTIVNALKTGSDIVQTLEAYADRAAEDYRQDTIAFIKRREARFMVSVVLIVFGMMAFFMGPLAVQAINGLG